jgi:hypothetical protein
MLKHTLALAFGMSGLAAVASQSVQAQQQCTPLQVVGTNQTSITKTVSEAAPIVLPGIRTNWNTDWAVPGGEDFNQFQARIVSEEGGNGLNIDMYLKYPDQTSDETYNQNTVTLLPGEPMVINAASRDDSVPYQVNLRIGGENAVGTTYTATVYGCR